MLSLVFFTTGYYSNGQINFNLEDNLKLEKLLSFRSDTRLAELPGNQEGSFLRKESKFTVLRTMAKLKIGILA